MSTFKKCNTVSIIWLENLFFVLFYAFYALVDAIPTINYTAYFIASVLMIKFYFNQFLNILKQY